MAEMMVRHHEGAVEMARSGQSRGEYADATSLTGDMVSGQEQEISSMKALLAS